MANDVISLAFARDPFVLFTFPIIIRFCGMHADVIVAEKVVKRQKLPLAYHRLNTRNIAVFWSISSYVRFLLVSSQQKIRFVILC
jgi:hypothetical protein